MCQYWSENEGATAETEGIMATGELRGTTHEHSHPEDWTTLCTYCVRKIDEAAQEADERRRAIWTTLTGDSIGKKERQDQ